jgi:hypothetical protein
LSASRSVAFACWISSGRTVCGTIPAEAGKKNAVETPFSPPEEEQLPQLRVAGEQKDGDRSLCRSAREAGSDHHLVPRQPVGPDAADQQEDELRNGTGGEHEAEVGLRPRQVDHREGERDRRHRVPEEGDRPACEEQAELAFGERA